LTSEADPQLVRPYLSRSSRRCDAPVRGPADYLSRFRSIR